MARYLTQTCYAALLATALVAPAWAQDAPPAPEAGEAEQSLGGSAAAAGSVVGGGGAVQPSDADQPSTPDADESITGTGVSHGSAADSGSASDRNALTRTRLAADLRSGQIGAETVETLEDTTRVQIMPLSEVDAAGGASLETAEEGNPPRTGGRTTNETVEGAGAAAVSTDGTVGKSTASPAGISEGLATGSTQVIGTTMGARTELDDAMEEAADSRLALQASLQDEPRIVDMLRDEGHAVESVIAVYATENGVEVIVDDRAP